MLLLYNLLIAQRSCFFLYSYVVCERSARCVSHGFEFCISPFVLASVFLFHFKEMHINMSKFMLSLKM